MEKKSDKKQRETLVILVHPEKQVNKKFIGAKISEITAWIFEVSKSLPVSDQRVPTKKMNSLIPIDWVQLGVNRKTKITEKNAGHLYGLAVYIFNNET